MHDTEVILLTGRDLNDLQMTDETGYVDIPNHPGIYNFKIYKNQKALSLLVYWFETAQ